MKSWKKAGLGIVLASRKWKFWVVFLVTFLVFGTILSLLSSGTGAVTLFFKTDFNGKIGILGSGVAGLFGIGKNFWDFLITFLMAVMQGMLVALIALVWSKGRKAEYCPVDLDPSGDGVGKKDHIGNAGLIAGLAILGSGCPTCGTALITPILGMIFSTGGYALAGTVSGLITALAMLLAILSLKKVGEDAYVIMRDEERRKNGKNH